MPTRSALLAVFATAGTLTAVGVASTAGAATPPPTTTPADPGSAAPASVAPGSVAPDSGPVGSGPDDAAWATPACAYIGLDDDGDMQVELRLTAPTTDTAYGVDVILRDGAGTEIATDTALLQYPTEGDRVRILTDTVTPLPAGADEAAITCEIGDLTDSAGLIVIGGADISHPATAADTCTVLGVDEFGDIQVSLAGTIPAAAVSDTEAIYALRDAEGTTFAYSYEPLDGLVAGDAVAVESDSVVAPPEWVDPATISCAVLAYGEAAAE